jgi:hypothetical protein
MDALWTVPPLAASGNLDMREGVVILPAAERVKLIASAKEALHHDSIGCRRRHIRRVLAEELEEPFAVRVLRDGEAASA